VVKALPLPRDAVTARTPICRNLARVILELRQALGIQQQHLAATAGISVRMLREIEKVRKVPTVEMMERIAAVLGLQFSELGFVADCRRALGD
jgi:transcriptional regulator with XRE-family HTH domain